MSDVRRRVGDLLGRERAGPVAGLERLVELHPQGAFGHRFERVDAFGVEVRPAVDDLRRELRVPAGPWRDAKVMRDRIEGEVVPATSTCPRASASGPIPPLANRSTTATRPSGNPSWTRRGGRSSAGIEPRRHSRSAPGSGNEPRRSHAPLTRSRPKHLNAAGRRLTHYNTTTFYLSPSSSRPDRPAAPGGSLSPWGFSR